LHLSCDFRQLGSASERSPGFEGVKLGTSLDSM
jgi:hypothetical protein